MKKSLKTREERKALKKYWAIVYRLRWGRKWIGAYAMDFYPEEHDSHLAELKSGKYRQVLGEYDTWEEAFAVAGECLKAQYRK